MLQRIRLSLGIAISVVCSVSSARGQTYQWAAGEAGFGSPVHSLTVYNTSPIGSMVYAGGEFASAGGQYGIYHIAKWNGTTWSAVGSGLSNTPEALMPYQGDLIAGGWFMSSGSTSLLHIARWNGSAWSPLGSGIGTGLSETVYALAEYKGELIAGGLFWTAGGGSANYIARWNGTSWAPLSTGMNERVYALAVYNGDLIAGGTFTTAGGVSASRIARWNGTTWSSLGGGVNDSVCALTVTTNGLVAGGYFTSPGPHLALWNGTSWSSLGGGANGIVEALTLDAGKLVVGGTFTLVGTTSADNIAKWDGWNWSALDGGVTGGTAPVFALCAFQDEILVGGQLNSAGGNSSPYWARWVPAGPAGACCLSSGQCLIRSPQGCIDWNGHYAGPGTTCTAGLCTPGACCFADGHCEVCAQFGCTGGAVWQGPNTTCTPNPCPQPGACCYPDGHCEVLMEEECSDVAGWAWTIGQTCDSGTCLLCQPEPMVKLIASDEEPSDVFGCSVAVRGGRAAVGAQGHYYSGPSSGAAYILVRSGDAWVQEAEMSSPDAAGGTFGWSISLTEDTVLIGMPGARSNTGAAYVFVRSGGAWVQQAELIAADGAAGDGFGGSVSLNGDTAVIGAPRAAFNGMTYAGAAYVFARSGSVWTQQVRLAPAGAAAQDYFGQSVAVCGDTIVVGVPGATRNGLIHSGAACAFVRSGATWIHQAEMIPLDAVAGDGIGQTIALDGDTAMVGAPFAFINGMVNYGKVYAFVRSNNVWTQEAKLEGADTTGGDHFGSSLVLEDNTAVIGAYGVHVSGLTNAGAAYLMVRSGGAWNQQAKLVPADPGTNDYFGLAVALSGDTVMVGSPYGAHIGTSSAGAVYVYESGCEGACCLIDGTCRLDTLDACLSSGGAYRGDGVFCSDNPCPSFLFGDLNCDGVVNMIDIPHFVQAIVDPSGYDAAHDGDPYPSCSRSHADMNLDGAEDGLDVQSFVSRLLAS